MPKHTEIIADTNQYAGGFQREMSAWVFGVLEDTGAGDAYLVDYYVLPWARDALIDLYGGPNSFTWQEVIETPSSQVGGGDHCSILWCFNRILTEDEIREATERIHSFAAEWNKREAKRGNDFTLQIEGVRAPEVEETLAETQGYMAPTA